MTKQSRITPFVRIVATDGKAYPLCPAGVSSPSPIVGTPATPSPDAQLANTRRVNLAGVVSPLLAAPATPIGVAAPCPHKDPTGGAGAPTLSTICPDCSGPFSYRIRDDETRCSYPVDPGEHYCEACDRLWLDADLIETPRSTLTMEQVEAQIARAFLGPVVRIGSDGTGRVEL